MAQSQRAHVLRLTTERFDIRLEPENPVSQIAGVSLLWWLERELVRRFNIPMTRPKAEEWGWSARVTLGRRRYRLGAAMASEGDWVLQIVKQRNVIEHVLGEARMTADDEAVARIGALIRSEPAFANVTVDRYYVWLRRRISSATSLRSLFSWWSRP